MSFDQNGFELKPMKCRIKICDSTKNRKGEMHCYSILTLFMKWHNFISRQTDKLKIYIVNHRANTKTHTHAHTKKFIANKTTVEIE